MVVLALLAVLFAKTGTGAGAGADRELVTTSYLQDVMDHRDGKRSRLAGAGLSTTQNVTPSERHRDALTLDRRGRLILVMRNVRDDIWVQVLQQGGQTEVSQVHHSGACT